jgi:hypothetical protein
METVSAGNARVNILAFEAGKLFSLHDMALKYEKVIKI